jgi:hypothetical protein
LALFSPSIERRGKAQSETMEPVAADENSVALIAEVIPTVTKDVLPPAKKKPDPIQDPWQEVADKLMQRLVLIIEFFHRVTMILVKAFLKIGNRAYNLYSWHFLVAK